MSSEDDLRAGPPTDSETDAMLDAMPPASEFQGSSDLARATARRARAVRLRLSGASYDEIARLAGYSDRKAAWNAVTRALQQVEAESVGQLRQIENMALNRDDTVLRQIIDSTNTPAAVRVRAIDSRLRLSARRSRLNGLDAPIQVALSAGVAADLADALAEAEEVMQAFVPGEVLESRDDTPTDERQEA